MMNPLVRLLQDNPALLSFQNKKVKVGNLNLYEEALLYVTQFYKQKQSIVIIKSNPYQAQRLYQAILSIEDHVLLYTVEESLRVEHIASSPENVADQIEMLCKLQTDKKQIIVTHIGAIIRRMPSLETFQSFMMHLKIDQDSSINEVKRKLIQAGYHPVARIDQPLTFAMRGGIIDVYSMNYDNPIRIEFFDTQIESIRFFDISTQRTIERLNEITIVPATLLLFNEEERNIVIEEITKRMAKISDPHTLETLQERVEVDLDALQQATTSNQFYKYFTFLPKEFSILDYMNQPYVIISTSEEVKSSNQRINEENIAFMQELASEGLSLPIYSLFNEYSRLLATYKPFEIHQYVNDDTFVHSQIYELIEEDGNTDKVLKKIITQSKESLVLLYVKEHESTIVKEQLRQLEVSYQVEYKEQKLGIIVLEKEMLEGFYLQYENIYVYTSKELFKRKVRLGRYHNKFKEADVLHSYLELGQGDFIVHNQHGVGKYLGIVTREVMGLKKDFLQVAYKGEDVLFVPIEQFKLIRKFVSKEGVAVKLNKLGSGDWEKTKAKMSANVADLAERLVKLYALREEKIGYTYAKDDALQQEFEMDFPYELTRDQDHAVKEIKEDMESTSVMDRLLCGDVGFGKTEVALRAIFKAVTNQKQVAYLCPTTILAAQHYQTIIKRVESYPVNVALLNRFTTPQEVKNIIQNIKDGRIDILIGTHRLLSKDIHYKDLGLLVIDEEQRFGVEHKEKIKEMKNQIDVLSLSATPIPRTLQMSLIGIRSLSQLNTPPQNRVPVQTYVIERNYDLVKEVIERELSRDGQVFYLHNNVKSIYEVAAKLKQKCPDAEIGVAHGRMSKEEIEDVMFSFIQHDYQILVCTTIIETGIDISNANTIIIDDADRFGLSQLYQIKGRVGRSDRLAYAYLMYAPQKQLTEIAQKRLKAIKEFTQLGSGYKIAMRDLTIRGAGDLLGPHQAGFIDTVGIDMYLEMLHKAIAKEKGEEVQEVQEEQVLQAIQLRMDSYIPESFNVENGEKLTIYQQLDRVTTKEKLALLMEELQDNFGRLPKEVNLLFEKKRIEVLLNEPYVDQIKELNDKIIITLTKYTSNNVDGVKAFEITNKISRDISLSFKEGKIFFSIRKIRNWMTLVVKVLENIKEMERRDESR